MMIEERSNWKFEIGMREPGERLECRRDFGGSEKRRLKIGGEEWGKKVNCDKKESRKVSVLRGILFATISLWLLLSLKPVAGLQQQRLPSSAGKIEFELAGQVGEEAQLPCLVGKQELCGEPYFIAWYKLSGGAKTRIEYKSDTELLANPSSNELLGLNQFPGSADETLKRRAQAKFVWQRQASCEQALSSLDSSAQSKINFNKQNSQFDCARLSVNSLELADEALYKCDVTYTESFVHEKCPATTESQLSVIARPNEPELLVNGRLLGAGPPAGSQQQRELPPASLGSYKEGAQVRLECLSSGGRPAPRIEWLNVTGRGELAGRELEVEPADVQLLRAHWPSSKKASAAGPADTPIARSSITLSLTRYDLNSNFLCLVLPQPHLSSQKAAELAQAQHQQQLLRNPAHLADLLNGRGGALAASGLPAPMLRWLKLDVQVKPSQVSVLVVDAESGSAVQEGFSANSPTSFYPLKLNRLYAIQCVVENSRPRSQVSWFNRTAPIQLEPVELHSTSPLGQLQPELEALASAGHRRLSSFTRTLANHNGTFRTIASLMLTTSVWDNFEELFCRVSNEAFQFDELTQVAPILPVRLYVNYAPFAWLESSPNGKQAQATQPAASQDKWISDPTPLGVARGVNQHGPEVGSAAPLENGEELVKVELYSEFQLRCSVAANPLLQSAILQIDWFKDGKRLQASNASFSSSSKGNLSGGLINGRRIHIEKTNHLHMQNQQQQQLPQDHSLKTSKQQLSMLENQLAASSKLMLASSLTINSLQASDAGLYSCHFRLIPAPGLPGSGGGALGSQAQLQLQQPGMRVLSGQANNTIRLSVIEAKLRPPVIKLLSERPGLFLYAPRAPPDGLAASNNLKLVTLIGPPKAKISLKCDLESLPASLSEPANRNLHKLLGHKVAWYSNGHFLHYSEPDELLNLTLAALDKEPQARQSGPIRCEHHILNSPQAAAGQQLDQFQGNLMRVYQSAEELNLRVLVEPKLSQHRKDLMPPLRSFSKLELEANSASKLKLACMAHCEPLCSIEWLFAGLRGSPAGADSEPLKGLQQITSQQRHQQALNNYSSLLFERKQATDNLLGNMILFENLIHRPNGSQLVWLSQSKLLPAQSLAGSATSTLTGGSSSAANASRELMLEASNLTAAGRGNSPGEEANVVSKLELTYNQIGQLLVSRQLDELLVECRLNPSRPEGHYWPLEPARWLALEQGSLPEATNSPIWAPPSDLDNSTGNALQTKILLDKPPKKVTISFGNALSTSQEERSVTLSEGQLLELTDPSERVSPKLNCQAAGSQVYPRPLFKWSFRDLNGSLHSLTPEGDSESSLNLRTFIEFRQRQLKVAPMSAYGVELVASIVGNYTCTAWNIHGSRSASIQLQIQGRPLCKLTLGGEFLGQENQLMASLRCSVYSQPSLTELIWFRNNHQLQLNESLAPNRLPSNSSLLSQMELPIMVLNERQSFMLEDLAREPQGNFKCVARNSLGFSEACELSPKDRQLLLSVVRPIGAGSGPELFPMQANEFQRQLQNLNGSGGGSMEFGAAGRGGQSLFSLFRLLASRLDWLLALSCSLALIWLLIFFAAGRKNKYNPERKLAMLSRPSRLQDESSWPFGANTIESAGKQAGYLTNSAQSARGPILPIQLPFQSSTSGHRAARKSAGNYYGNFSSQTVGDSEMDMVQSCSQSSHYDDFLQQQHQERPAGQQQVLSPGYGHSTFRSRKQVQSSSLSNSSSAGESSIESSRQQQLIRLGETLARANAREFPGTMAAGSGHYAASGAATNVPLIATGGLKNSRINVDQQARFPPPAGYERLTRLNQQQQQEPIYDDVIYHQMIL